MHSTTEDKVSNEAVKKPLTQAALGKAIDKIFALRGKKAELEAAMKDIDGQIAALDSEVMEAMHQSGLEKTATKLGTVSISTSTVAQVEDWDKFLAYSLNPFEFRAGLELQGRKNPCLTSTCRVPYGRWALGPEMSFQGAGWAWGKVASTLSIVNVGPCDSAGGYTMTPFHGAGRSPRWMPSGRVALPRLQRRPRCGRG